jgi:hypothetical protein
MQGVKAEIDVMQREPAGSAMFLALHIPKDAFLSMRRSELAAMEAAASKLATALHPQLFLVETYRLTSLKTAQGKGASVSSVPLLPGEEKTFEIRTSFKTTSDVTSTTTVMESQDTVVANNFNDHVKDSSTNSGSTDSADYHMDANFHGDASVGIGSGEVNAQLGVKGGSNEVRSDFGKAVENSVDKQIGQTSASRRQSVNDSASHTSTDVQTDTVSTDKVKNPNPTHTVTVLWFQLLDQYTSFLSLVDVGVAFKTTDVSLNQQVALHDLDKLLNEVVDPAKVSRIRQAIKGELEVILDFEDEVRNIVEEVPFGPNHTLLRLRQNLQSTYVLKDGDGNAVRNIHVDGVLLKAMTKVIPSRQMVNDLLVGEVSAV